MDPYGLPVAMLIAAAGVSADTARRWKRHRRIPPLAARLVQWWAHGDLGALDRAWTGFTLRAGQLWTPYQFSVGPGDISAIPYRFAQIRALERELRTPAQWDLFGGSTMLATWPAHDAREAPGQIAIPQSTHDAHAQVDRLAAPERRGRSPRSSYNGLAQRRR